MFVLRRITSEGLTSNTMLGESYQLIDPERGQRNQDDFDKLIEITKSIPAEVYGFISYNSGNKQIPLYKKSVYFIMVSNGRTFENITWNQHYYPVW